MENGFLKIREELTRLSKSFINNSYRRTYYTRQLEDLFEAKISSIHEVLSDKDIKAIWGFFVTYNNIYETAYISAHYLSQFSDRVVKYVEGLLFIDGVGKRNYAFVKVDDKYIDPMEFWEKDFDLKNRSYGILGEYTTQYVAEKIWEWGYVGDVYLNTRLLIDAKITK